MDAVEGGQGGGDVRPPQARVRHGLAAGAGGDPDRADQLAHGPPQAAQEGPPLAARTAADGGPSAQAAELPAADGPRGLPRADEGPRAAPIAGAAGPH